VADDTDEEASVDLSAIGVVCGTGEDVSIVADE